MKKETTKSTIVISDDLHQKLKIKAIKTGKKLKEFAAEILEKALKEDK